MSFSTQKKKNVSRVPIINYPFFLFTMLYCQIIQKISHFDIYYYDILLLKIGRRRNF